MTNAVKNSTSRSAASLPVVGVLSRFLYEQLMEEGFGEGIFERDRRVQPEFQSCSKCYGTKVGAGFGSIAVFIGM